MYNPLVKAAAETVEVAQVPPSAEQNVRDALKKALVSAGAGTVGGLSGLGLGVLAGKALGLDIVPGAALAMGAGTLGGGLGLYTGEQISAGQGWVSPDKTLSLPGAMATSTGVTGGLLLGKWLGRKLREANR